MTDQEFLKALPTSVLICGNWETREVYVGSSPLLPGDSQKVRNHSPDGFTWGYVGSGPAQFALALLMLYVDAETAQQYYQRLKFAWVGSLPQSDFGGNYDLRGIMRGAIGDPDLYTTNE